jgi:cyclopropane fatty-acyl-phospholipid synthase-like methyltransferase
MTKFSKTSHIQIIEEIAKGVQAAGFNQSYLELGIAKGACFNRVAPYFKRSVAVDINDKSRIVNNCSYSFQGTTDDYFKVCDEKFDLIFIDANHHYKFVETDFVNSTKHLKNDGIIILHDTFPPSKEYLQHCHDAWRIQEYIKEYNGGLGEYQYINLPFYYGLTLVKRHKIKSFWL